MISGGLWPAVEGHCSAKNISLLCQPPSNQTEEGSRLGLGSTWEELARNTAMSQDTVVKFFFPLSSEIIQVSTQQSSTS